MAKREVKFKGRKIQLVGPEVKVGDTAPEFECVSRNLEVCTLASTPKKARLFSVVPSLDTPVCSDQTKKFDESVGALKDLARRIPVIPVLVGRATMPRAQELPAPLQRLARMNAAEVRAGRDMEAQIKRLIYAIEKFAAAT